MENWQTGDLGAFEAMYRQYEKLVFRNAYLITGKKEEAEDVLQDVFLSVWKSRHTFDPGKSKLTTWLHRITVNECFRKKRKQDPEQFSIDDIDIATPEDSQEESFITKEEYGELMKAMDNLDHKHRAVLVLRYFNELSYDEIAQAMDIPLGTVKSRIFQALSTLRSRFQVEANI
jgi:RNA polymerase sigma-70 factor, ECF subfamily